MVVTIVVMYIWLIHGVVETNESIENACYKTNTTVVCCSGYFEFDGRCIECFGALGTNCSVPCEKRTYGYRCKSKCNCSHDEVCNKYIGCVKFKCFGALGTNCSVPCHNTTYGYRCKSKCNCSHDDVCNKYIGCVKFTEKRNSENVNKLLIVLVGFGCTTLSLCLMFVGVMFYRWRQHLQRTFRPTQKREGFQVNLFSVPSSQEIHIENYANVRESRMSVDDMENHKCEMGEYRINSMEYNHLFSSANVKKSVDNHSEQLYNTVDARFTRKETRVTFSEFPDDDFLNTLLKPKGNKETVPKSTCVLCT